MSKLKQILDDESYRAAQFPVVQDRIFFGHAGVTTLPRVVGDAMRAYIDQGEREMQESAWALERATAARRHAAQLLGAQPDEIALLGPTALGLGLVAAGIDWERGDEVVFYSDDYPSNVYPWQDLERLGVKTVRLDTEAPGVITWEQVEPLLTDRTRLVALASCNFLSGYRIDISRIGAELQKRDIRFCLDAIQTVGAFPTPVEHVDFLSADSHKWMLGPAAAGIVYVRKARFHELRPAMLGSMNVQSPDFVAQRQIEFYSGARRYEPGILNLPGILGMEAALALLLEIGTDAIATRLLELRRALLEGLRPLGYRLYLEDLDLDPATPDSARSAIVTVHHPGKDMEAQFESLKKRSITASLRKNRAGQAFIRFSPHFYNTLNEVDQVVEAMR